MRRGPGATSLRRGPGGGSCQGLAAVRVRTGSASTTSDLAGYLRRCDCLVELVDDWTLQVSVQPPTPSERHARIELDAYLRVWETMKGERVDRLETGSPRRTARR
jgi:hypothetical protein